MLSLPFQEAKMLRKKKLQVKVTERVFEPRSLYRFIFATHSPVEVRAYKCTLCTCAIDLTSCTNILKTLVQISTVPSLYPFLYSRRV